MGGGTGDYSTAKAALQDLQQNGNLKLQDKFTDVSPMGIRRIARSSSLSRVSKMNSPCGKIIIGETTWFRNVNTWQTIAMNQEPHSWKFRVIISTV